MEVINKMKKFIYFFVILAMLGFLVFYSVKNKRVVVEIPKKSQIQFIKLGDEEIKVEVVDTIESRAQGLSGKSSLEEDEGMLFVFDIAGVYPFWMKDMNFPIDIIWMDENQKVIYIKKNATPESYPESFWPKENSKYVLEVSSMFTNKHNIKLGDKLEFLY